MNIPGMKRLSAAVVALTLTGTASAVPIAIDFAGELVSRDTSRPGQAVEIDTSVGGTAFTAQFIVEIDDFAAPQFLDTTGFQRWTYSTLAGATGISAYLTIGGEAIDLAPYEQSRAQVAANDTKGPIDAICNTGPCSVLTPDFYSVSLTSTKNQSVGGNTQFRGLNFFAVAAVDPMNLGSSLDFIDGMSAQSLASVLMLPSGLSNPQIDSRLLLNDQYTVCSDLCRLDYHATTVMRIDSLSRYVYGVPEPGTFALFGLGLAGTLLARRRRSSGIEAAR